MQTVNLVDTKSWDEVVERTKKFAQENPRGLVIGQRLGSKRLAGKEFPSNEKLNELFPDRPVMLTRIDGHAAIANQKALEIAGVKAGDKLPGGDIEVRNGRLTGILIDNAKGLVGSKIPSQTQDEFMEALEEAQANCFAIGLTTIDDCGLSAETVEGIKAMQASGKLKMRLYVMLSDSKANFDYLEKTGIIKTDRLNVRSIKVYADGALGSRGACLLQPYSDKPGWSGFLLSSPAHFDSVANFIYPKGWQMCTHAIGDSGNRTMLKIYAKYLKGKNDLRWRIEHSQVVNQNDFDLFGAQILSSPRCNLPMPHPTCIGPVTAWEPIGSKALMPTSNYYNKTGGYPWVQISR